MIIPWDTLEASTLSNLIESFVLREGTDYGVSEISLKQKVKEVKEQLQQGKVVIVWSELHGSVTILPKESLLANPSIQDESLS